MIKRGYRDMVRGLSAYDLERIVDAYVLSDRDREIIKMSLVHGISYTRIADRMEPWLSTRAIQNIMNRWMPIIMEHLQR